MVLRGWGRGRRRIDDFADDGDDEPEKGTNFRERGERCPQADHGRARIIFCYGFDFGEEAMDGWMDGWVSSSAIYFLACTERDGNVIHNTAGPAGPICDDDLCKTSDLVRGSGCCDRTYTSRRSPSSDIFYGTSRNVFPIVNLTIPPRDQWAVVISYARTGMGTFAAHARAISQSASKKPRRRDLDGGKGTRERG